MRKLLLGLCLLALLSLLTPGTMTRTYAQNQPATRFVQVCGAASLGHARCLAIRVDAAGLTPSAPGGYGPSDLQSAYKLPAATAGSGQTVAIVDAFNDPKAESDLGVYRSTFGLSPCTTANGCFRKVNQSGGTTYPPSDIGWSQEISLDLDMVSAICPKCHILLVEANDNSFNNLGKAVNEAVKLQANEVSNSYGGSEFSNETSFASFYNHPGHVITASSGDSGYSSQIPAAFNTVTSVGGTTLNRASNARGWSEKVWSGTGSGCSGFIPKPGWQSDTGCNHRALNDVSADANPSTGVAVYDTFHESGWLVFGGTSVSSPIIASVYALAGNAGSVTYGSYPYSHRTGLFDVTSGSNGSCGGSYLCTAKVGYDGPTGLGTPKGTSSF